MTKHADPKHIENAGPTVNVVNLLRVADAIENIKPGAVGFNMKIWHGSGIKDKSGHGCKTTACIAGHAQILAGHPVDYWLVRSQATMFLGLTKLQAFNLFYGELSRTSTEAVRTLRHLALTGEVCWDLPAEPA